MRMGTSIVEPTEVHRPFGKDVPIGIYCFGKETGDWRIDWDNPSASLERLMTVGKQLAIDTMFCPRTSGFNAEVVSSTANWTMVNTPDITLARDMKAAGVVIPTTQKKLAVRIASADCPTIVVWNPATKLVTVAHGGLDDLIDRTFISNTQKSGEYFSVVEAIVEQDDSLMPHAQVFITTGIGAGSLSYPEDHEVHSPFNQKLHKFISKHYGAGCWNNDCLDLGRLIRAQFEQLSEIKPANIKSDGVDTYTDKRWCSNRRGDTKRNLILVTAG